MFRLQEVKRSELCGFVVMERFKENLKHFITRTRAQGYHPVQHLISMCRGLIHGLAFLHNQNIYHGRLCVSIIPYMVPTPTRKPRKKGKIREFSVHWKSREILHKILGKLRIFTQNTGKVREF